MAKRDYDQGELTVHWDSGKCIHSANCIRAASKVFRPKERPWIDVSGADAETIAAAVDTCPTGALAYTWHNQEGKQSDTGEATPTAPPDVAIRVTADGPYEVSGSVRILDDDGGCIETTEKAWLCRCGNSQNKPFCDGSHRDAGFSAPRDDHGG